MDLDFQGFDDFHIHINPSSSVLQELAYLRPPSPILKPSDLPESCTSADIPIILFESPTTLYADPFGTAMLSSDTSAIPFTESISTLASVGTFGPRRKAHRPKPILANLTVGHRSSIARSISSPLVSPVDPIGSDCDSSMVSETSVLSFHTALSTISSRTSLTCRKIDGSAERTSSRTLNRHPSSLFSPNPSPLSSIFPMFPSSRSNRSTSSCSSSVHSRSSSPGYDSDGQSLYRPESPLRSRLHGNGSALSLLSFESPPRQRPRSNPNLRLPPSLAWLHDSTIGLLIDQEGFRSIHPSMKFVGFSENSRTLDPQGRMVEGGVAQFMPKDRQAFHFHYALFDSLPILRRLTLNGDESRDHISRQATLSLKSKGVYTIRGSETIEQKAGSSADASRLRWKFDYMVDDRKSHGSNKIVDGEKTLTPLTFSCSPMLLHPNQGKKIRFMHIVKKSVVTKLVAERVEPPTFLSAPLSPVQQSTQKPISPQKSHPAISRVFNLHRRVQSQSQSTPKHTRQSSHSSTKSEVVSGTAANVENHHCLAPVVRRRRASSAGERTRHLVNGSLQIGVAVTNHHSEALRGYHDHQACLK